MGGDDDPPNQSSDERPLKQYKDACHFELAQILVTLLVEAAVMLCSLELRELGAGLRAGVALDDQGALHRHHLGSGDHKCLDYYWPASGCQQLLLAPLPVTGPIGSLL